MIVACMSPELHNVARTLIELGANVNAYRPGSLLSNSVFFSQVCCVKIFLCFFDVIHFAYLGVSATELRM